MLAERPAQLEAETAVRSDDRRVERAHRHPGVACLAHDLEHRGARQPVAAMFGQRRHRVDARHGQVASAEPLAEPVAGRGRHDPAVHVGAAVVRQRHDGAAVVRPRAREVERRAEQVDDLFAVLLGRRSDVRRHRGSHPHGRCPHRGQPCAYRAAASSRSTPSRFASDASHASTSPNSCMQVVAIAGAERPGQLADLLGQPAERGVPPARGIPLDVRGAHRVLQVADLHGADESNVRRAPVRRQDRRRRPTDSWLFARLRTYIRSSAMRHQLDPAWSGRSGSNIAMPAENDRTNGRPSWRVRLVHRVLQTRERDLRRVIRLGREEHAELVAAHPSDQVRGAERLAQHERRLR